MKKSLLCLLFAGLSMPAHAQDFSYRYGRVTDHEIRMETYAPDPAAPAVVLYEEMKVYYLIDLISGEISRLSEYWVKIKVLTTDGTAYADVSIPFLSASSHGEQISSLSAAAYNREGNRMVKTELRRQYIFTEDLSETRRQTKFSIPEVKAGSVIEYRYSLTSKNISSIPDLRIQRSIPVLYSNIKVHIPEYLRFHTRTVGYHPLEVQRSTANQSANNPYGDPLRYTEEVISCEARDVPALKDEALVWNVDDFGTRLVFELAAFNFPGSMYRPIAQNWASVNRALSESDFQKGLTMNTPYREEVAEIRNAGLEERERIRAVHRLVLSRMSWNDRYGLFPDSRRQVSRESSGSSADLNFILISALKEAGFDPTPILLNPRHYGRIPQAQASVNHINAFVVGVPLSDGTMVFLDATDKHSDINVLPPALLVDRARLYGVDNETRGWVNLTGLTQNFNHNQVVGSIGADGVFTGMVVRNYSEQQAFAAKRRYGRAESEEKYIQAIEEEDHLTVSDYQIHGLDSTAVREQYSITLPLEQSGDYIYVNASLLPFMSTNRLTQQQRILPVEYNYPERYAILCVLEIPEGYEVEEVPEPVSVSACDNGVRFTYQARVINNRININLGYQMSRIIYPASEYTDLQTFFGLIAAKSEARIVLKKL